MISDKDRRYNQSEKGKERRRKWRRTAKGRAFRRGEMLRRRQRRKRKMCPRPTRNRRQRTTRIRLTEQIRELKAKTPCADCGLKFHPVCMDFDHRPGEIKIAGVAALVSHGSARALDEIKKCDIVCANCHRLRTFNRRNGK